MKATIKFFGTYPLLSTTLAAGLVGLILLLTGNAEAARWTVSIYVLVLAAFQFKEMVETLREGSYGIDILAVTAIVSTTVVGEYWAALVVCLMLTGGEALEDYAQSRAGRELTSLLDRAPADAHRIAAASDGENQRAGEPVNIPVADIEVGDLLIVYPHEVIPVDGTLESEHGTFDESQLTGESLPVEKTRGEMLMSGSLNGADAIRMRVSARAADSQYQRIIELVKSAQDSKPAFVRLADRVAVPFTAIAFIIAGSAWAISGDAHRFAEVLVVATPCPLIIAAPVAFMAGMSRAARAGIIVKNGTVIERAARTQTIAFDKTGTLTTGTLSVRDIVPAPSADLGEGPVNPAELLALAAEVEKYSAHPVGQAIVRAHKRMSQELGGSALPAEIISTEQIREVAGFGVEAQIKGKTVKVGRAAFANPKGSSDGEDGSDDSYTRAQKGVSGESIAWVSADDHLLGHITLSDEIRPETPGVLAELAEAKVGNTVMLTGDARETAEAVAAKIGVGNVRAGLLPGEKVEQMTAITERPVMMVGDGVNDAPVLAASDIGVAMGARGSAAAAESADVVIMVDDLGKIPHLLEVSRHTMKIAWQAIAIGVGLSVILMLIGASGIMPAIVGAWMQELVDLACILWALLAMRDAGYRRRTNSTKIDENRDTVMSIHSQENTANEGDKNASDFARVQARTGAEVRQLWSNPDDGGRQGDSAAGIRDLQDPACPSRRADCKCVAMRLPAYRHCPNVRQRGSGRSGVESERPGARGNLPHHQAQ